jgi:hypothetical protein
MNARLAEGLAELRAQLGSCMSDLSTMPRHMAGTEWHADRADEARWLVRTIARYERLAGRDAAIAAAAPRPGFVFVDPAEIPGMLVALS